jgi:hypothetical protein
VREVPAGLPRRPDASDHLVVRLAVALEVAPFDPLLGRAVGVVPVRRPNGLDPEREELRYSTPDRLRTVRAPRRRPSRRRRASPAGSGSRGRR